MINQKITKLLTEVLKEQEIQDVTPQVDYPADPKHGDYTTNVAMTAAKKAGKNPREFAGEIKKALDSKNQDVNLFEKIEIAGPGFVNLTVKNDVLINSLQSFDVSEKVLSGKKIMVEFTDPNPFKEFHIGHLYSNIVGESLCRLLEANGAEVWRVDYFGDVGMHVAKSLWGLDQKLNRDGLSMEKLSEKSLKERIGYLGQAYALGAEKYEEETEAAEEMRKMNRLIYIAAQRMWEEEKGIKPQVDYRKGQEIDEDRLNELYELYKTGRKWSLEYFEIIYKRLGTKFDAYYPESLAGEKGYRLVMENLKKDIFKKSNGAVIFPGEDYGLHTRVFINQLGLPTYEAKELGLAPWKYEEFAYDQSIIVTGNEINAYFEVLITALKKINPEMGEKAKHLSHGMVKLPEGKMSSRTGKIVTGEWLLDEASKEAQILSKDKETAEKVAIGAVKYALLKSGMGKDVEFSFAESISFEGNSGPYLQYTYARTQSVLNKFEMQNPGSGSSSKYKIQNTNYELEQEERDLLRFLTRFDELVEEAALKFSPNILCTYLFELAQTYNTFYQKHQIIKVEETARNYRLWLTRTTGETLKSGLHLLGIQAPEKM